MSAHQIHKWLVRLGSDSDSDTLAPLSEAFIYECQGWISDLGMSLKYNNAHV